MVIMVIVAPTWVPDFISFVVVYVFEHINGVLIGWLYAISPKVETRMFMFVTAFI